MDLSSLGIDAILLIFYIFLALGFSFICSVSEAALLSMTPSYIASLKDSNPKKASKLEALRLTNVDRSLAAILTVNTVAHTLGAIGAGSKATAVFGDAWFGVFSAVMTLLILFLSEIVPKTLGAQHWKKLSGFTYFSVNIMVKAMFPLIWVSEKLTKLLSNGKRGHDVNRDELVALANIGGEQGVLNDRESDIIRNLLGLRAVLSSDVMTPRIVVFALNRNMTVDEALHVPHHTRFSRIPIYEEDKDHLTGFVLREDLMAAQANDEEQKPLHEFERELQAVPETAALSKVLDLFLKERQHIAVVVSEYGESKGIITLEDVLETLVGEEIIDEGDKVADMRELAKKRWQRRARKMGVMFDEAGDDVSEVNLGEPRQ